LKNDSWTFVYYIPMIHMIQRR